MKNLKSRNLFGLLWEKGGLDVWKNTTLSDGNTTKKFVQFFVISDGELKMSWDDSGLLVITGSVASEFKDFSRQVFHDSCQVNWGTSTYTFSIITLSQKSVDTSNWELETSTGGSGLGFWFGD